MLVTLAELLAHMDSPSLNATALTHIENVILPGVQGNLEEYCGRALEKVRVREALTPDSEGYILFSHTPVWEVVEIMRPDGTALDLPVIPDPPALPSDPSVRTIDNVMQGMSSMPFRYFTGYRNPYLPLLTQYSPEYWVTYYAGPDGHSIPGLKEDILKVAARNVEHKYIYHVGMRQGAIEAGTETDDLPLDWTEEELEKWDRLRRRIVV